VDFSNLITDHHAVLGVPIDADVRDIRKRYLNIARRLHPDSTAESEAEKQWLANYCQSLSTQLTKNSHKRSAEYIVLLKEMSKRLVQESLQLNSRANCPSS